MGKLGHLCVLKESRKMNLTVPSFLRLETSEPDVSRRGTADLEGVLQAKADLLVVEERRKNERRLERWFIEFRIASTFDWFINEDALSYS